MKAKKAIEKARVPKELQDRVEQWAEVLEITQSRLVGDAIRFYIRFLEGKTNVHISPSNPVHQVNQVTETVIVERHSDDDLGEIDEEFDGGIDL